MRMEATEAQGSGALVRLKKPHASLITFHSTMSERNARFAQVVGRHLDIDLVTDADADEIFAHLARDMGQDFVAIGQSHPKHRAR